VVEADQLDARTGNRKGRDDADVSIGGVTIPRMLEAQHFLITGTTGAGKTQVINGMLRSIRKRGNRAVIADPAGGFYARFGKSGDVLFNPFDRRSVDWSPFAEIRADYDCERIAKAIIPDLEGGESAQWQLFAQTLLAKAMLAMHRNGERSMKRLMYWMASADQKELEPLLAGTAAAVMCQRGNDKMLNNTRATMLPYLSVFDYLPDEGRFSIRQWIQEDWRDNWLFITYRDDQMGMLRNLVATALEMALVEGLSLSENQERGLWFVMDEVDSLGKVTSLRAGLTKLRKYGGRCVLGLQTVAQLRTTYGRDEAQTLIANTSVKCILRAGDSETAKSMEHELGEQEIERSQVNDSFSMSDNGQTQSQSTSTQVVRQSAVLASEIMGLPDLQGFLKIPGDEIARIRVEYVAMPDQNPAFE
jgi:type IV secretory pathway TraG/TraD family ATPase VirD4